METELIDPSPMKNRWSPQATPHVVGEYADRAFDENELPKPQAFMCRCTHCGAAWGSICTSGNVRQHIASFALRHLHRDSLASPEVRRPGSLRMKRGPNGEEYVKA